MGAYPPFAVSQNYSTKLDPLQELMFRDWVQKSGPPFDVNATGPSDYDVRGYYRGMVQGNPQARPSSINQNDGLPHFTDYYKTPLHESFSRESQWAGPNDPAWINDHQLVSPGGRIILDEKRQQSPLIQLLMNGNGR